MRFDSVDNLQCPLCTASYPTPSPLHLLDGIEAGYFKLNWNVVHDLFHPFETD